VDLWRIFGLDFFISSNQFLLEIFSIFSIFSLGLPYLDDLDLRGIIRL